MHYEPEGFINKFGFVKSNPLNNASYLEDVYEVLPGLRPILSDLDAKLDDIIPGYNIAQIKIKFNELCYYIDIPIDANEEQVTKAWSLIAQAENSVNKTI